MHPAGHFLFGALLAGCIVAFGIEMPRRRRGLPKSSVTGLEIATLMFVMGILAVLPQASRFFGDRKLDTGPIFNLFLFHDALNLASQRFRLGDGILDPPVTVLALGLGLTIVMIVYLRSEPSSGWHILWRDLTYFCVIVACLIAIRSVVSASSYVYMPKTYVHIHSELYIVVDDMVFSRQWKPVAGRVRDQAISIRDCRDAVNSTSWFGSMPEPVRVFLQGGPGYLPYPLEYDSMVSMLSYLSQAPGPAPQHQIAKIVSAGTLPRTDIPLVVCLGFPAIALSFCAALLYPALPLGD